MATKSIFAANAIIGATAGALDDIAYDSIKDEDLCIVIDAANLKSYFYAFDSSSGEDESSPDIIKPEDAGAEAGRWKLTTIQSSSESFMRTVLDASSIAEFLAALNLEYDHLWIPASAMVPTTTNGAESTSSEEWDNATNDNMRAYLGFDKTTDEYACFDLVMPSAWDRSTIKFKPYWTGGAGTATGETVCWVLQAAAVGNNEDLDTDQGTEQTSTDTLLDDDNDVLHIGPASSAITVANAPALGDLVHFKIYRDRSEDTADGDALLFGIMLEIKYTQSVSEWS